MLEIKYPLDEDQKERILQRCREVLDRTEGFQTVILLDQTGITDYYQNACLSSILEKIKKSAEEYHRIAPLLISIHE